HDRGGGPRAGHPRGRAENSRCPAVGVKTALGFPYVRPRVARRAPEVSGSPARRTPDAGVDRVGAVPDNETQLTIDTSFRTGKPEAIRGRKATGPSGSAGLPKRAPMSPEARGPLGGAPRFSLPGGANRSRSAAASTPDVPVGRPATGWATRS